MSKSKTENLTYERAAEVLRYDSENGVLERKLKNGEWQTCGDKPNVPGYGYVYIDGKLYLAHRLIWLLVHGEWPEFIDHIDRDRMNNRITNLRDVSRAENNHNQRLLRNNTSGYPGVHFSKQHKKYMAYIAVNGKRIHLGLFNTAEEAFTAFMIAKIKYHPSSPDAQQYLRELTVAG